MARLKVGIIGATGMVGQRFITLLDAHPRFEVVTVAASASSAGKTYAEAVSGRWAMAGPVPAAVAGLKVQDAAQVSAVATGLDFVFCAVDLPKDETLRLEEAYARAELPVVSNNSAARGLPDVPMLIPEINAEHLDVLPSQRARLGTRRGCIVVKPNCSLQSYVPALAPLRRFGLARVSAVTYQAISGAGKTFATWPEMTDNVIPFIKGEEEKSEREPLKIFGQVNGGRIVDAYDPRISAQCIRVPVSDGHLAAVSVDFVNRPSRDEVLAAWQQFSGPPQALRLPSAPGRFLTYFDDPDRPQTGRDRDLERGMGVAIGRLREDSLFHYKFVCLSHNTVRGAAGGAVLMAELMDARGLLSR
jgi:aspartate-semialdehyde dehydrogenase